MESSALVRKYYHALDDHEYGTLETVLAPDFVQCRPDRTFEGREAFVRFMREDRPNPNTSHELEAVIAEGGAGNGTGGGDDTGQVAVRGRVRDGDVVLFGFADFFELDDGRIERLETYSR